MITKAYSHAAASNNEERKAIAAVANKRLLIISASSPTGTGDGRRNGVCPDKRGTDGAFSRASGFMLPALCFRLYHECLKAGIREVSIYSFTKDNTKRPAIQKIEFTKACVSFASELYERGAALLVVGDEESDQFPEDLKFFRDAQG